MNNFLDKKINTPELLAIKAMLAHSGPADRRLLMIVVKLIEISRLFEHLKEVAERIRKINTEENGQMRRIAVMELMMPYLSAQSRQMMQMVMVLFENQSKK